MGAGVRRSDTTDAEHYNASLSANQLIYDGGRTWDEWEKSKIQADMSLIDYRTESANVRYKLRIAYVNLLKSQKMVDIWNVILNRRKQNRRLVKLRYEAGREHKGALLTAEARELEAEVEFRQATRLYELAKQELINVIGITSGLKNFKLREENFTPLLPSTSNPDFFTLALQTFPVARQHVLKNIAEISLQQAKKARLPSVQLNAETGVTGKWPPDEDAWSAGLSISVPIFEGGKKIAEIKRAEALAAAANERYEREVEKTIQTMRQKWVDYLNALDRMEVRKKYQQASSERAKIAEAQYSGGILSFDNWIIIENEFVDAEKALINTQAEAMFAEAAWNNILGRTLEYEKDY